MASRPRAHAARPLPGQDGLQRPIFRDHRSHIRHRRCRLRRARRREGEFLGETNPCGDCETCRHQDYPTQTPEWSFHCPSPPPSSGLLSLRFPLEPRLDMVFRSNTGRDARTTIDPIRHSQCLAPSHSLCDLAGRRGACLQGFHALDDRIQPA